VEAGDYLIYLRRFPDANQPCMLVYPRDTGPGLGVDKESRSEQESRAHERVIVDPNHTDPEGRTAIDWWFPSPDGRFVAYGLSTDGDEESTMNLVDTRSGVLLPDTISRTRFATVGWLPDSSGFFYTRNARETIAANSSDGYYHRAVYRHRLAAEPETDPEIFPDDGDPETQPAVSVSRNGRWLVVRVHRGWDRAQLHLRDLSRPDEAFLSITEGVEALFNPILVGDRLYLHTNYLAPRYRLMEVDLESLCEAMRSAPAWLSETADPNSSLFILWTEVVAERPDAVLEGCVAARDGMALHYVRNATSEVALRQIEGGRQASVALPPNGTVTAMTGWEGSTDAFLAFESFTTPPLIYRLKSGSGDLEQWLSIDVDFQPDGFTTNQVWFPSKDGTQVSMFVMGRPELPRDGSTPLVLMGYGGFNVSMTPAFNPAHLLWLGGRLAVANLRGGGEYGEEWHRAGMRERKQNVFDDFAAASEYLIEKGYTSSGRLAIYGGSNGGLLVGATVTQRPGLCRAAVCAVPLLDMLRYQEFLIARLWIPEYGSSASADEFRYLRAYSPYHNVSESAEYPAILFTAAESDGRVDPAHARKMTARMQGHVRSRGPILLRLEDRAGHGAGKPVRKLVDQYADMWSFLLWQLYEESMSVKPPTL
jgi:prolyl oligopeptidase